MSISVYVCVDTALLYVSVCAYASVYMCVCNMSEYL